MSVFVLNMRGEPLMPTTNRKARVLLRGKKAKIAKYEPFTIQLTIATGENKQEIILGVDAGSKTIGLSATTSKQELFSAEVELRNDIVDLLSTRREARRTRRNRLRYRRCKFDNKKFQKTKLQKPKGWLAPSIKHKINTHLGIIEKIHKILPISKIIVETASFDIQKIQNPEILGSQYQEGNLMGFWNVREYVLHRDGHKCQHCKGKSKDKILNVHHIESRKTGGNSQNNLITLCETCHNKHHKGEITVKFKRGQKFNDASFMGIMRWAFFNTLKETYKNVKMTFGYITKNTRIQNNLPKEHRVDALCITGNIVKRCDNYFYYKKIRRHNRQIHKANILKGGIKRNNQASYLVKGFRLFDKIEFNNDKYFIFGRRNGGSFQIRKLDGTKPTKSGDVSYKKLKFISINSGYILEERSQG